MLLGVHTFSSSFLSVDSISSVLLEASADSLSVGGAGGAVVMLYECVYESALR